MTRTIKAFGPVALAALLAIGATGCENMNHQQQRALSGGAIGAAGGAVVGAMTGAPLAGAVIGGAGGAAIGGLTH